MSLKCFSASKDRRFMSFILVCYTSCKYTWAESNYPNGLFKGKSAQSAETVTKNSDHQEAFDFSRMGNPNLNLAASCWSGFHPFDLRNFRHTANGWPMQNRPKPMKYQFLGGRALYIMEWQLDLPSEDISAFPLTKPPKRQTFYMSLVGHNDWWKKSSDHVGCIKTL